MTDAGSQGPAAAGTAKPALFVAYPQLAERIRHVSLGEFPTAIERIPGPLPGGFELWVKREDLAGRRYGGNKVRKLEFLLAAAQQQRAHWLLTLGGFGSNHVLATAIYGGALGMRVAAVLFPQPLVEPARPYVRHNLLAGVAAGLQPQICRSYAGLAWAFPRAYLRLRSAARADGGNLRYICGGGSNGIGTLGWWSGGLEIAQQIAAGLAPRFDAVYVALGSGGTTAGLRLGLGSACQELVAVRVVPWPLSTQAAVQRLSGQALQQVARALGLRFSLAAFPSLRIDPRFLGGGYGHGTAAAQQALAQAADLGLRLDPTYTAKAFAALWADAKAGRLRGKRVLFVHTYNGRAPVGGDDARGLQALPAWLASQLDLGSDATRGG